ncbi:MAG: transcription termination/antitermination protein NusA, partial [Proteobacteria bacterium]|nr:transcription termination/antitermination protein NusA [Pseudomonadota bacterium]
ESYRPNDRIVAYVKKVQRSSRDPQIILSRTDPALVIKLFEQQVPEIDEGVVQILRVARQPGMRTKVAVYSSQNDIDPVGACVGMRGQRVQAVVSELRGEKIDIVPFHAEPARFVCSAISPAEVSKVLIDEASTSMELIVPDDQLSLAIGRGGQNVRLAAQLTGWNLDIISESRLAEIMQEAKRSLLNHGIEDESLIDTLFTLGYNKLEHIARVDPLELAQIPGFGMDNAEHIVSVAMEILAESKKVRTNKEEEARNIKAIATYLGLTNNQARQVYAAGYKDLSILFLESDPHRLDAKTGIGQNRAPELIEDLYTIATEDGVYTEEELAEAREIFDRSLRELPNCTLAQAYNCTVESVGERKFPRENEELDDVEDVNDEIENIDEDGQE